MSLPNFMCLGAAKSGTTTLYDILRQHPDIYIPRFKEPHFFDIPENYKNGIEWYKTNYFRNANKRIIADFTPSYFFEKESPKRIFKNLGKDMKFVVILRNPVDRAYSHYLHSKRDEYESLSFNNALENENVRLLKYQDKNDYLSYLRKSYVHQGLYAEMLQRYLVYYSLENFLFIDFEEEFLNNRKNTINTILAFLELDNSIDLKINLKSNPASKQRSRILKRVMKNRGLWKRVLKFLVPSIQLRQIIRNKIQRANISSFTPERLDDKFKIELFDRYFKEDIINFEKISKKKLSWYL